MAMNHRLLRPRASGRFLLDQFGGAAAAYSLRRLSSSYTGPAVQVRRSNDNAEETFTPEQISSGALASWVGSGNDGHVKTWYDQSGNDYDATQSTSASQPKIVQAGVLVQSGGRAALSFDGNDDFFIGDVEEFYSNEAGITCCAVGEVVQSENALVGGVIITKYFSGGNRRQFAFYTDSVVISESPTTLEFVAASPRATDEGLVFSSWTPGSGATLYRNGNLIGTSASINDISDTTEPVYIGSVNNRSVFSIGTIKEILVYASDKSAARPAITANVNSYYGVF